MNGIVSGVGRIGEWFVRELDDDGSGLDGNDESELSV